MAVPEHILKVARPAQTVVIDTKKDTPLRYVVKKDNADLKKEREAGLLDHMTYGDLLDMLNNIWRMSDAPRQAARDDGYWQNVFKDDFKLLEKLGLIK